jgi:hypothetical protein
MDRAFRDKNDIACFDMMCFIINGNGRFSMQDVLFMLQCVRVARHPTSPLHGKFSQRKVGAFLRGDEDLNGRVLPGSDVFGFNII